MKTRILSTARLSFALASALAALLAAPAIHAADVTWDITPGTVGAGDSLVTGGLGAWNTTNGNWTTDAGVNNSAWVNANNDTAVFGDTGGAVTLGTGITVGGLTFNTAGYTVAGNTLTFGSAGNIAANTDAAISSVLAGSPAIAKTATGILTLSGANTFSGQLTVENGTLSIPTINNISANGTLGNSASSVILGSSGNTGRLQYTGGTATSTKTLSLATGGTGAIEVTTGATNLTLSGVIGGGGGLTKTGAGQLTLSGTNSFTGPLSIENGRVFTTAINNKSANGVLGAGTAVVLGASGQTGRLAIQVDGGISSTKDFTLATGGTGEIQFGNLGNFSMTNADRPLTLSGIISGSGNFVKLGGAAIVLSGNNTYSGTTTVNEGPLRLSNANAIPGGIGATGGTSALTINGNTSSGAVIELTTASGNFLRGLGTGIDQFQITGGTSGFSANGSARQVIVNNDPAFELQWGTPTFNPSALLLNYHSVTATGALTLQNKIDLNAATRTIQVNANTATLSGDIRTSSGTAGITKTGSGILVLSGTNAYNGTTTFTGGSLSVSAAANLGTGGNLVFNGGTLQYTGAGTMDLSGRQIVWTPGTSVNFNASGGGTLVIDQSYSGVTTVSAGNLQLSGSGSMTLSLINNGTFVVNKSGTATQGTDIPSFLAGTGSLTYSGGGTLVLNTPTYYTGTTKATAGTVKLSNNLAIRTSALDTTGGGSVTLDTGVTTPTFGGLSGATGNLATIISSGYGSVTNLTLNPQSGSVTYGGVIADGATGMTLTKTGAGTQVLQGASTYSGTTNLNAGILELSGAGSILNSAVTFGGGELKLTNTAAETGSGRVHDTTAITSNGGTFTYNNTSGANVYAETTGSVALTSGQLNIVEAVNQAGAGSQTLALAGLTQAGTSAVTFSAATTAPNATKNMIMVSGASGAGAGQNLPGGVIIGPWATTGTAANAQTDYAVYDASGYVLPANITASAETTWTTTANAYTLSIPAKTAAALSAARNITALKESSTATAVSSATANGSPTFTVASGHSLAVGDPVVLGGVNPKNFSLGTVYYVASVPSSTTFTLAATPGGAAINAGDAQSPTFTGGLKLDSGKDLGTFGILNAGTAAFGIGRTAVGGTVTLPAAGAGNLFATPGSSGLNGLISIDAPIVDNGGALTLAKDGAGVLRLTGTNTYTGGTVLNAGTVAVTAASHLGAANTSITFNGSAALSIGPNANWSFGSGGTIDLGSHPITVNNRAVAGLYYNSPNTTITVPGAITGSGGIIYGRDPVVTFGGGSGGENISLSSTGNTFTGPLTLGVSASENIGTPSDISFNSLADSSNPITFNLGGGGWTVSYGNGATAPLAVPNRPIDLRNSNATIRNQSGTQTMTLGAVSTTTSGAKTLNLGNGGGGGFVAGAVTDGLGSLSIAKSGTGTWTISGNIRMSGGISGSGGTLALGGTNTYSGDTSFYDTTLIFQGAQSAAQSSKIVSAQSGNSATGLPRFLDDGTGTVSLANVLALRNGQNGGNFSHTVFVGNNGSANGGSNPASTATGGTIALASMIFDEDERGRGGFPTVNITGANGYRFQLGDVTLAWKPGDGAANTKTVFNPTTAPLTITGTVALKSGATVVNPYTLTLDGSAAGNLVSGTIRDAADYPANANARPLNLTKSNSSTWTLSSNNTYTGATTIAAGTLLINGNQSAATGAVAVNGGTLGGTGTVGGTVTVASAGSVAPGTSAGTLAIGGGLDISAPVNGGAGKLKFELGPITASDQLAVTGTLAIGVDQLDFSDFVFTDIGGLQNGVYKLITSGGISGTLDIPDNLTGAIGGGTATGTLRISEDNKDLELIVSGLGGGAPEIAIEQPAFTDIPSGGSQDFGTVTLGSNASLGFTIRNTGTADLNLTGTPLVSITGTNPGDFTVTSPPASLVTAGNTTTFTVRFTPGGAGARGAALSIANDDTTDGENPFIINLNGTGQTPYDAWSGGDPFGGDANGDGVKNGLAWLLGATDPNANALGLLPKASESGGNLVLEFNCLSAAKRGTAVLNLQHSGDVGLTDTWAAALVPGTAPLTVTVSGVNFATTANGSLIRIIATVPSGNAAAGKLFGRLSATYTP
jgi:autotransporter-associated beta strand protein